jgi:SpoVK/Ycf46/Vps4 family AAA+-type ATPase
MSAWSLSTVKTGTINCKYIVNIKKQLIRKNPVLEFYEPQDEDRFDNIGGYEVLKTFLLRTYKSSLAKGVLLLGVPGTGKSSVARAMSGETGLPLLILNFARSFGSLVGESEQRILSALKLIDSYGKCVVLIDELEKGIAGINSSGRNDSGVGNRVYGTFLQWMSDKTSEAYVFATSNDISKLPPEFLRAERWDSIFFTDLPTQEERAVIWKLYKQKFGIVKNEELPNDENWTGAEIRTCCRLAKIMNTSLLEAAQYVVPIYRSMEEKIIQLRNWAQGRCVNASLSISTSNKQVDIDNDPQVFI